MKKHYIIASCIIMAVLVAYYLFNTIPRRVPLDECSELYLHYAGQPGINASFVKDFRINDSLSVNATLLQAKDTSAWYRLMEMFLMPKQKIDSLLTSGKIIIRAAPRGHPESPGIEDCTIFDVITIDNAHLQLCFFHANDKNVFTAIMDNRLKHILKYQSK